MKQPKLSVSPCCHEPALLGEIHQFWSDWIKKESKKTKQNKRHQQRFEKICPGLTRLLVGEGLTDCWIAMGHRCVATQHSDDIPTYTYHSNLQTQQPAAYHGDNRPPGLQIEIKGNPGWMMFSLEGLEKLWHLKFTWSLQKCVKKLVKSFGSPRWTLT